MSILIKGMDMPTNCWECPFVEVIYKWEAVESGVYCRGKLKDKDPEESEWQDKRYDDCPLVEIPKPHGRLIDGDKLIGEFIDWQYTEAPDHLNTKEGRMVTDHERQYEIYLALGEAVIDIANAPTILEEEK